MSRVSIAALLASSPSVGSLTPPASTTLPGIVDRYRDASHRIREAFEAVCIVNAPPLLYAAGYISRVSIAALFASSPSEGSSALPAWTTLPGIEERLRDASHRIRETIEEVCIVNAPPLLYAAGYISRVSIAAV